MVSHKPQKLSPVTAALRKKGYEKSSPWNYIESPYGIGHYWEAEFRKEEKTFTVTACEATREWFILIVNKVEDFSVRKSRFN